MDLTTVLQIQLSFDAERAGQQRLAAASRRWFEVGAPALGGSRWRRLRARSVAPGDVPYRWDGEPGQVWGECSTLLAGNRHDWGGYTSRAWDELVAACDGPSTILAFTAYDLAELVPGRLYPGFPRLSLSARYIDPSRARWWGLKAQVSVALALTGGTVEDHILAMIRQLADEYAPVYGEISYDNAGHMEFDTSLEHSLGLYPWQNVGHSHSTLRGYGWLTIVGQRVARRLDGQQLAASGAFARVEPLRRGGYWLQATERFADYDMAAARRVQEVLAPVLPAGLPRVDRPGEAEHLVAPVNAHPGRSLAREVDWEPFRHRLDPRYGSAHRTAVQRRETALRRRYPAALVRRGGDTGPDLMCRDAVPGEVWVWRFLPEDDAYAGMDIARVLGDPGLHELPDDPPWQESNALAGPTFAELGLAAEDSARDMLLLEQQVTIFDGGPGVQLYYSQDENGLDE